MSRGKNRQKWPCKRCHKSSYGSASRAREASANRTEHHNTETQRAYPCPVGNGWHLTSEEAHAQ